jgi:hypothetical protein
MHRCEPYQLRDNDGRAVTAAVTAADAKTINERWTVPAEVRARRRSKRRGRPPQTSSQDDQGLQHKACADGGDLPLQPSSPTTT